MIEFVRSSFRKLFSVILWITLIGCIVTGCIIGGLSSLGVLGVLLGGGLGVLLGFFSIIVGGGLVATFLNIDENIQIIADGLNYTDSEETDENQRKDLKIGNSWICGKCGTKNALLFIDCKKCGAERN